ncbi:MAG: DUF5989 family protein [Rhodospirillales bacterium]
MLSVLKELFRFMRTYRKFWMAPVIVGLVLLGMFLVAVQSSAILPFIYAVF